MTNTLEVYLRAYPDHILSVTPNSIVWRDGVKMEIPCIKHEKTYEEKLDDPNLLDQISIPYVLGEEGIEKAKQEKNYDPGRLRYVPFFQKMYGSTKEEVEKNLVWVEWLPKSLKNTDGETYKLPVTKINGVADKIQSISDELDGLSEYKEFLDKPGGTFCYRLIAGTDRQSAHSFGMTIDINVKFSNYWLWDYKEKLGLSRDSIISEKEIDPNKFPEYINNIPLKIVEIFEKHGFIWGGKWSHYDTMHFEYRPELLPEDFLNTKMDLVGNEEVNQNHLEYN